MQHSIFIIVTFKDPKIASIGKKRHVSKFHALEKKRIVTILLLHAVTSRLPT